MDDEALRSLEANQVWIASQNLSEFAGEWIAVHEQAVIARGQQLKTVMDIVAGTDVARDRPLYMRVPEGTITS